MWRWSIKYFSVGRSHQWSVIRLHYTTASKHNSYKNNQQKRVDCLNLVCHTNKNLLNFFAELGCPLPGHWPASRSTDIVEELERVCMFLILNHQDIEVILEMLFVWYIELLSYYLMQMASIKRAISFFKLPQNDENLNFWHVQVSVGCYRKWVDNLETDGWWLDRRRQSWEDWLFVEHELVERYNDPTNTR